MLLGSAYGELGCLHSLLGNFEQAISCLQHQLRLAQQMGDQIGKQLVIGQNIPFSENKRQRIDI